LAAICASWTRIASSGDAVARADHLPRGIGDDRQDILVGGGGRHRTGGVGERAERVAHSSRHRIGWARSARRTARRVGSPAAAVEDGVPLDRQCRDTAQAWHHWWG
jgi:hypothetical protein